MNEWRVLPYTHASAARQLAQTEALWRSVMAGEAPATLRWYGYDASALVLGVGQRGREADEAACRAAGVAVVQRASGGAAVLAHHDMLALDVALPADSPLAVADVVESYRWLGEVCTQALRGLAPRDAERVVLVGTEEARADQREQRSATEGTGEALRGLACFGTLSPYEVGLRDSASGRMAKLVGLSQVRKRGVVLYQAGLYVRWRSEALAGLLALPAGQREKLAGELDRRIASLEDVGVSEPDVPALVAAINAGAAAALRAAGRR
jgi:lipoate-protein ligase A